MIFCQSCAALLLLSISGRHALGIPFTVTPVEYAKLLFPFFSLFFVPPPPWEEEEEEEKKKRNVMEMKVCSLDYSYWLVTKETLWETRRHVNAWVLLYRYMWAYFVVPQAAKKRPNRSQSAYHGNCEERERMRVQLCHSCRGMVFPLFFSLFCFHEKPAVAVAKNGR